MRRSELWRPVSRRELWILAIGVAAFLTIIFVYAVLNPPPHAPPPKVLARPEFVLPLWALILLGLFWRWRRERGFGNDQPVTEGNC